MRIAAGEDGDTGGEAIGHAPLPKRNWEYGRILFPIVLKPTDYAMPRWAAA
jgi:hypothetical protein